MSRPADWKAMTLQDVVTSQWGGTSFKTKEYSDTGTPVLTKGDVKPGGVVVHGGKYVDTAYAEKMEYKFTRPGDFIVTTRDLTTAADFLGLLSSVPKDRRFLVNQGSTVLRIDEGILDARYFVHWCSGDVYRGYVKGHYSGATQIHIRKKDLMNAPIWVPPLPTQRKIASILSAYDYLIENNTRRIAILEEMAQAIYREWFVNFRFPGHENVNLVDSLLGQIPEGWVVGVVNDLLKLLSGFAFKSRTFVDDGNYKVVTIKHVHDGIFQTNSMSLLDSPPERMPAHCHLEMADVLISLTGNIGRTCLVFGENFLLNQRVAKLHPHRPQDRPFVYWMFRYPDTRKRLEQIANGVAQQNLSTVQTGKMEVPIPPKNLRDSYAEVASPIVKAILNLNRKNANLRTTRDLLIPKLISGKLDVEVLDIEGTV